ncbi:MAG: hypothetical protein ACYTXY_52755, partial [Nostoc sp.]
PQTLPPIETKKILNVRLNGINYRSEKTKNAFALALQDGYKVTLPTPEYSDAAPLFTSPGVTPPLAVIETNGHKKPPLVSAPGMNGVTSNIITQTEQ